MTLEQGHINRYCKPRTPYQVAMELPRGGRHRGEGGVGGDTSGGKGVSCVHAPPLQLCHAEGRGE